MPVRIRSFVVCSRAHPATHARTDTETELSRKIETPGWKRERKEKNRASTRARTKEYNTCISLRTCRTCLYTCIYACVCARARTFLCFSIRVPVYIYIYVRVKERSCTQHPVRLYLAAIEDTIIMRTLSFFVSTQCLRVSQWLRTWTSTGLQLLRIGAIRFDRALSQTNTHTDRRLVYTLRDEAELLLRRRRFVRPTPREKYTHFLFQISSFSSTWTLSNLTDNIPMYCNCTYLFCLLEKSRFSGLRSVKKKRRHRTSLVRKHSRQTATHGYGPPPRSAILDSIRQTSDRTVPIASVALLFPYERETNGFFIILPYK